MRKLTHKEFIDKLSILNYHFKKGDIRIVEKYRGLRNKIIIDTKYGQCKVFPENLLRGDFPSIKSAIDKSMYCVNKFISIHKEKYNYSLVNYKLDKNKVTIVCPLHGNFKQVVNAHLSGKGCLKCSNENSVENSIGWKYSRWQKAGEKSKNFDSFKVYIIRCWNEDEEFYKIGKTYKTVVSRFSSNRSMPYNYEVIKIFKGEAEKMSILEKKLQKDNKNFVYLPKINFGGKNECYSQTNI